MKNFHERREKDMRITSGKRIVAVVMSCLLAAGGFWSHTFSAQAETSSISAMFDRSDDNTWLFAGGVEVQGRYAEIKGNRNFTGHFEETVRRGDSGGAPEHQRYTINVGQAGQDIAAFAEKLDGYIEKLQPKAISYMIGEEDYGKGVEGVEAFKASLTVVIQKALAMKNNGGFAVIQLPHAVKAAAENEKAAAYANAAKETMNGFTEAEQSRIVCIDHYVQTNNDSFKNGNYLTEEGRLNGYGHLEIARQLCRGTFGSVNSSMTIGKVWEEEERPDTYLAVRPETEGTADGLMVHIPEETGVQGGCIWKMEINGLTIAGEEAEDSFEITGLPQNKAYKLTVRSKDGGRQLASVYGKTTEGKAGGKRKLNALQQKIVDKVESDRPLTWVFTGDSITHGLVHTKGYDAVAQIFEKYLKEDLGRTEDVVINTGVSSTDTVWALENIEQRVTKYKPDIVSVMLGTNDVYTNVRGYHTGADGQAILITKELYRENLENMVEKIRESNPEACIIFRSPTPTTQGSRDTYLEGGGYLQVLEDVAKKDGNILYIDQYQEWNKELRAFRYLWGANYYYGDGNLHPGAAGQLWMMQKFTGECGLDMDTNLTNLSYKFSYAEETSNVTPTVIKGDKKVKVDRNALQSAYAQAGGTGNIGALEMTLTGADGKTYTQSTGTDGEDFVMKGIPYGTYSVQVVGTRTDTAAHVTFAEQTVTLSESQTGKFDVLLDSQMSADLSKGQKAGVLRMDEMAPDAFYTYTLCEGEGSSDNALFQIKGRTLKINAELEANHEYHIRVRAEGDSFQYETALVIRTGYTVSGVRTQARNSFASDKMALDIDLSTVDFDGTNYVNLADPGSSYYENGAYLTVLNHLRTNSAGGTILMRFKTSQAGGLLFGAGSTTADDGKNMIFGTDNTGKFRGYFRTASGNGLKGSMGTGLDDGEWHTIAIGFDTEKADNQNQVLVCVDGQANIYPSSWWTNAFKTWFSVNSSDIAEFSIGGGEYASGNFDAFRGKIEFITITNDVYSEEELRTLSGELLQKTEPESITKIEGMVLNGDEISVPDEAAYQVAEFFWNKDGGSAVVQMSAEEGYVFDEEIFVALTEEFGYSAEVLWQTDKEILVTLTKKTPSSGEEDNPKPDPKDEEQTQKLAAPTIVSLKSVAEKKKAGIKIAVSRVVNADSYTVYRVCGGKTVFIGRTDAKGVIYDTNPVNKKTASYYAVAESSNAKYTKSGNGTPKSIRLQAAVKKVTVKRTGQKAQVRVSWKKVKGAKGYVVYRSTKKNDGFVRIKTMKGAKKTAFLDKRVKKGKSYYYRIVVKTKKGYSAPKASKAVKIRK